MLLGVLLGTSLGLLTKKEKACFFSLSMVSQLKLMPVANLLLMPLDSQYGRVMPCFTSTLCSGSFTFTKASKSPSWMGEEVLGKYQRTLKFSPLLENS